MSYRRIFFWRYLAVGMILVLAFGPVAGGVALVLAYWPVLRSSKRAAGRISRDVALRVALDRCQCQSRDVPPAHGCAACEGTLERHGDALVRVYRNE